MRTFDVFYNQVEEGIPVEGPPPHVSIGIGRKQTAALVETDAMVPRLKPCPNQGETTTLSSSEKPRSHAACELCGEQYDKWRRIGESTYEATHPHRGLVQDGVNVNLAKLSLEGSQPSLVPADNDDNQALVRWHLMTERGAGAQIEPGEGVEVVAAKVSPVLGNSEVAGCLAILQPGQRLHGKLGPDQHLDLVYVDGSLRVETDSKSHEPQ